MFSKFLLAAAAVTLVSTLPAKAGDCNESGWCITGPDSAGERVMYKLIGRDGPWTIISTAGLSPQSQITYRNNVAINCQSGTAVLHDYANGTNSKSGIYPGTNGAIIASDVCR